MSLSINNHFENTSDEDDKAILKPCHICGRTFNPTSLERHEKICERTKKSNRRTVFNSFLQRANEIGVVPVTVEFQDKEKHKQKKRSKEEHGNVLHVTRGGKNSKEILNNGLSPQKVIPPGYEQCPWCERHFNQKAADRHMSWCQEQRNRLPKTPPNTEALERLKARVKYQAPLSRRRGLNETSQRLVKSAESVRESSCLRTHSSPPIAQRVTLRPRHSVAGTKLFNIKQHKEVKTSQSLHDINSNTICAPSIKQVDSAYRSKKAVKFKEMFPVYDKERKKNLDMLAALRLRLSELSTSDDFLEDLILSLDQGGLPRKRNSNVFLSSAESARDSWTSDGEPQCSTSSSSSNGSLPSVSTEKHLPRFCYNCGTKYPIVSAKYCCECGAQRFTFGANGKPLSVS